MVSTIRNPIEWTADQLGNAFGYVESEKLRSDESDAAEMLPRIHRISVSDLRDALRKGYDDFKYFRTDVALIALIYPIVGGLMIGFAFEQALIPLIFPAIAGFALVGPFAGVGMYEMSRRREAGKEASWADTLRVLSSPSFGAIFVLGLLLLAIFGVWILAAHGIFNATLGPETPVSAGAFLRDAFTTGAGWVMIVVGFAVGFLFAVLVLIISVVSFPLLLDRPVGLPAAIITSARVAALNRGPIAVWGLIVAGALALGMITLFVGLIVLLPILGHATWHLYRKAVH